MSETEPADDPEEGDLEPTRMTLGEHLDELRSRLIKSVGLLALVFLGCWSFYKPIGKIVLAPGARAIAMFDEARFGLYEEKLLADPELDPDLYFIETGSGEAEKPRRILRAPTMWPPFADGATGGFFFSLTACLYFTFFIGGPFALWQLWQFIAAGLYKHEKKTIYSYFPTSLLLFFGGVLFGYFVMVPYAYYLIAWIGVETVNVLPKVDVYFQFLRSLSLALGVVFQLPLVMIALSSVDLVDPKDYGKYRGHFAIAALVIAALLTPPDPITQMMMAGPMVLLYEVGLHAARWRKKKRLEAEGLESAVV